MITDNTNGILSFLDDTITTGKENQYCQMSIEPEFDDEDDKYVRIVFTDNLFERDGDYLPLEFNKDELQKLVDFLSMQLEKF